MKRLLVLSLAIVCLVSSRNYTPRIAPDVYKRIVHKEIDSTSEIMASSSQQQAPPGLQKAMIVDRKRHEDFERTIRSRFGQNAMPHFTRYNGNNDISDKRISDLRLTEDGQAEFRKAMLENLRRLNRKMESRH